MKIKETLFFFLEVIQIVAIALVVVLPIRYFVFQPFIVKGASMESTFHNGDYLIIDELTYRFREPQRGEVVVFKYPQDLSQRFIKRIIGLPGEQVVIRQGGIEVIDKFGVKTALNESGYISSGAGFWLGEGKVILGPDEYFVLGDNRGHSFDSRNWGALKRKSIVGRVVVRAWPPTALAHFLAPEY